VRFLRLIKESDAVPYNGLQSRGIPTAVSEMMPPPPPPPPPPGGSLE